MAKEAVKKIKIQIEAGNATPTRDKMGDVLPVEISIYEDRSFDFVVKTPPTAFLLKKYAKVKKGSVNGARTQVATISEKTLREIAEIKLPDLNAYTVEEAMKIVEGTARNMGIGIEGHVVEVHTAEKPVYEEEEETTTEEASTEESAEENKEETAE